MKGVLFCAALVAAFLVLGSHAQAMVEYCPATAVVAPLGAKVSGDIFPPAQDYSVYLTAETPRSVSGSIAIHASQGWFSVPFSSLVLTKVEDHYRGFGVEFTRRDYRSDVVFVHFPMQVTMGSAFVSIAKTSGETILGWDAKGDVACPGHGDREREQAPRDSRYDFARLEFLNPPSIPNSIPANATVLTPALGPAPGDTSCAEPFHIGRTMQAAQPQYPDALREVGASGMVLVEVGVNAQGTLDDAWIYAPSGNKLLDDEALRAARLSKYAPGRAFCQAVPGLYLFRAVFTP